ncbi:MAG: hypothetical protein J6I41_06180 [Bacteroidales bacterium]|nr:hypothetical protein [Bacteroidales bacterium]
MKKNIFALAAAVLMLGMTACQKEEIVTNDPVVIPGDNPGFSGNALVKTAADLQNTDWTATFNLGDSADWAALLAGGLDSAQVAEILTLQVDLAFGPDSAHFTFPQDVTVLGFGYEVNGMYTMQEMDGLNLAYDYTAATHTGNLVANDIDATGALTTYNVPFTYSDQNDDITILLIDDANDTLPLVFVRG